MVRGCFSLVALMGVASGSYVGGASGASWVRSRGGARASPHHLAVQVKSAELGVAAKAAATVVEEVSRSVKSKGVEAPDAVASFVSMDEDRRGLVDDEGLPLIYDKGAIQKYWDGQGGALQQRWGEFLAVSVPFITRTVALLISGGIDALEKNAAELARDARVGIETLGPTYVKMGQMLSVRPDVLPQAALDELIALQDGVEGFETSIALAMIESELQMPLMEVFEEFDMEPAAAASLAQVYRAKLRSGPHAGAEVAVKVQRPGVQSLVSKDLYVLRRAAEVYQGLVGRFAPQQRTDYVALLNEWAVGFYTELDFKNEAANMKRMTRVLEEASVQDVMVPKVYDDYTTRRVLVSEWVDGKKLSDCEPGEIKELIKIGQECFLVQLLQAGFFHSDPHPGNLIRPNDQTRAKLCLIDFGLVAQVRQDDMDSMVSSSIHLANKDYTALVDDFIALKILPDDCNRAKVIPLMDKALSPYVMGGGAKKYEDELKKMYNFDEAGAVGGFQAMTQDLLTVLNEIPFSIPAYFALLARAVVTLEGLALSVDPDYGLVIEAYPFVARKLLSEDRPELQQALQQVLYSSGPMDGTRGFVTPTRLAALLNSAAGIVAKQNEQVFVDLDAVPEDGITLAEATRYLLSPGAASLRSLLFDEAVNAADLLLRQALRKSVPMAAAALPQPPTLPFLPPPPEPLSLPLPLPLPSGAMLTNGRDLLDALAPPLNRDEELYAISLTDLIGSSLGADIAGLVGGEVPEQPVATARMVLPAIAAAAAAGGSGATASTLSQLANGANNLLEQISGQVAGAGAHTSPEAQEALDALTDTLGTLSEEEQAELQGLSSKLQERLVERLNERLLTVR